MLSEMAEVIPEQILLMVQAQDLGICLSVGNRVLSAAVSRDLGSKGKLLAAAVVEPGLLSGLLPLHSSLVASSFPPASHSPYNLKATDNRVITIT